MAIEKRNIEKRTPTTNENDTDEARDLQFENLLQSDHPWGEKGFALFKGLHRRGRGHRAIGQHRLEIMLRLVEHVLGVVAGRPGRL